MVDAAFANTRAAIQHRMTSTSQTIRSIRVSAAEGQTLFADYPGGTAARTGFRLTPQWRVEVPGRGGLNAARTTFRVRDQPLDNGVYRLVSVLSRCDRPARARRPIFRGRHRRARTRRAVTPTDVGNDGRSRQPAARGPFQPGVRASRSPHRADGA